jgi:hypothetical protein
MKGEWGPEVGVDQTFREFDPAVGDEAHLQMGVEDEEAVLDSEDQDQGARAEDDELGRTCQSQALQRAVDQGIRNELIGIDHAAHECRNRADPESLQQGAEDHQEQEDACVPPVPGSQELGELAK